MSKYFAIIKGDLLNTKRDPTLILLCLLPLIMLAFLRFAIPALIGFFPEIEIYTQTITVFFVVLNALVPAFIMSFIFLDEKDMQLFPVLHITPLSFSGVLVSRISLMIILSYLFGLLMTTSNGIYHFTTSETVLIPLLSALNTPIITLFIITIAKNKIEGLTILKIVNMSIILPLMIFFIDSPWENLLAIFPAFWAYKLVEAKEMLLPIVLTGIITQSVYLYLMFRWAVRKCV